MSRFGKKILLLFLFLAFSPAIPGQADRVSSHGVYYPGESIKISRSTVPAVNNSEHIKKYTHLSLQGAKRIVWQNNYLYTAGVQNFCIIDTSVLPPDAQKASRQPPIIGSCLIPALSLAVCGHYAYLVSADGKLNIVDVSDPAKPVPVSLSADGETAGGLWGGGAESTRFSSIQGIALLGDLLLISEKSMGISVVDLSDPQFPKMVGQWREKGDIEGGEIEYGKVVVWENQAAVLWKSPANTGFWLIDLTRPQKPAGVARVLAGDASIDITASCVTASGAYIFLANGKDQSLEIYTFCRQVQPIGSYSVGRVNRMLISGHTLYLAQADQGVLCLDVSLPDQPVPIRRKKGYCLDLAAGEEGEIYALTENPFSARYCRIERLKTESEKKYFLIPEAQPLRPRSILSNLFGLPFFQGPIFFRGGSGPVISSISPEETQNGATATLMGQRLSAQVSTDWIHFNESQGSFEDKTGWKREGTCWMRDNWECWAPTAAKRDEDATFDPGVSIIGNQSYRNNIHYTPQDWKFAREDPGKGAFYNLTWWEAPDAEQYYYRYYVRYSGPSFQWTNNSWKQLYVHDLFNLNPCMWDHPPVDSGPVRYDIQGQTRVFAHLPAPLALERWYCLEIWVKKNGPGVDLKFWLDGEECKIYDEHDQNPQQFPWSKCYQGKNQKLTFGSLELGTTNCQNWRYEQLPVRQSIWFDGFAMSSSRIYPAALVEIGNHSDYARAKRIKQELLHISDTRIQIRINTAGLGRGPYYLWVTNNKQERSAACPLKVGEPVS